MSDVSSWSETAASNNSAAPNGWPEGQMAGSVNDCAREMMGAIKRSWDRDHATATVGGTANAITLTYASGPAAYVVGEKFAFRPTAVNTGAATINVSGLGALAVKVAAASGKQALQGGELASGQIAEVEYDGTDLVLLNPVAAEGSWTPAIAGGTTAGTQTYAAQVGRYLRIGNVVHFWASVTMTAKDAATAGNIFITGLPFAGAALAAAAAVGRWGGITLTAGYTSVGAEVVAGTTTLNLVMSGSGQAVGNVTAAMISAATTLTVAGSYRLD